MCKPLPARKAPAAGAERRIGEVAAGGRGYPDGTVAISRPIDGWSGSGAGARRQGTEAFRAAMTGSEVWLSGGGSGMDDQRQALLDGFSEDVRRLCLATRARILELVPDARETVMPGYKSLAYGFDGGMSDEFTSIVLHANHVNLQLHRGTGLPDPSGLLEGTGKRLRHVKIRTPETIRRDDVTALILAGAALARS